MKNSLIPHPSSLFPSHKGFTLVELIVVIGIIGVLAGVLLSTFSGGTESARTATCLANMRNLAAACQTYGAEVGRYPLAGSIEYSVIDESDGIARAKAVYKEIPGWISWSSMGAYRDKPSSHQASASWMSSMYSKNDDESIYCLTNGALSRYVSSDRKTYVCPSHALKHKDTPVRWSYLMNAYFGWDTSEGGSAQGRNFRHISYGELQRADRILLFCEIPFTGLVGSWQPDGSGSGRETDCVLQFNTSIARKHGSLGVASGGKGQENIGFNHKSGKETFANVVFADGHTEKLRLPKGGLSDGQLRDLTAWLCTGEDVSFDGKQYRVMEN